MIKSNNSINIKLVRVPAFDRSNHPHGTKRFETYVFPPLGLATLTAYMRKRGFFVDQDDINIKLKHYIKKEKIDFSRLYDSKRILAHLRGKKDKQLLRIVDVLISLTEWTPYNLIGLSAEHSWIEGQSLSFLLADRLKEKYSIPKIVLGGGILRETIFCPQYFEENEIAHTVFIERKLIDYLIVGEGEEAFAKLCAVLFRGEKAEEIFGLIEFDTKAHINEPKYRPSFIVPDFTGLPLEKYRYKLSDMSYCDFPAHCPDEHEMSILLLPFRFIYGCPNSCAFCFDSCCNVQKLEPQKIVESLSTLVKKYNTRHFIFFNNLINPSCEFIIRLADALIESGLSIQWVDSASCTGLDAVILKKLKQSGCIALNFGLESASPRMLKYCNKKVDLSHASYVLRVAYELNIWTSINLIVGLPTENEEDLKSTETFFRENLSYIANVSITKFRLIYGSRMYNNPEKYNINAIALRRENGLLDECFDVFSFDEIGGRKQKERLRWSEKAFKKVCAMVPPFKREPFYCFHEGFNLLFHLFANRQNIEQVQNDYYAVVIKNQRNKKISIFTWKLSRSRRVLKSIVTIFQCVFNQKNLINFSS